MAGKGGGWNSFMQSTEAQVVLYGIVVAFCAYYAIDGVRELMDPERAAPYVEVMGQTTYYVVTVARVLMCLVTGGAFARMMMRMAHKDE